MKHVKTFEGFFGGAGSVPGFTLRGGKKYSEEDEIVLNIIKRLPDYIEIEKGEIGVSEDIQNSEFVENTNYFVDLGDIKFKIFKSENKWGGSIIKLGGLDKARRLSWSKEDKDKWIKEGAIMISPDLFYKLELSYNGTVNCDIKLIIELFKLVSGEYRMKNKQ
jgi:hypothetical protein